jgi:hypothetical protein
MTKQDFMARMDLWNEKAGAILFMFDDDSARIPTSRHAEAQEKLRKLKEELQAEYKRLSPEKVQEALTEEEKAFYMPAVQEAWSKISSTRVDSQPDQDWYSALDDVQMAMQYNSPKTQGE